KYGSSAMTSGLHLEPPALTERTVLSPHALHATRTRGVELDRLAGPVPVVAHERDAVVRVRGAAEVDDAGAARRRVARQVDAAPAGLGVGQHGVGVGPAEALLERRAASLDPRPGDPDDAVRDGSPAPPGVVLDDVGVPAGLHRPELSL